MTYDEVCNKVQEAVRSLRLAELTKDMNLMERAAFVQGLSAQVDFQTVCIWRKNHPEGET